MLNQSGASHPETLAGRQPNMSLRSPRHQPELVSGESCVAAVEVTNQVQRDTRTPERNHRTRPHRWFRGGVELPLLLTASRPRQRMPNLRRRTSPESRPVRERLARGFRHNSQRVPQADVVLLVERQHGHISPAMSPQPAQHQKRHLMLDLVWQRQALREHRYRCAGASHGSPSAQYRDLQLRSRKRVNADAFGFESISDSLGNLHRPWCVPVNA